MIKELDETQLDKFTFWADKFGFDYDLRSGSIEVPESVWQAYTQPNISYKDFCEFMNHFQCGRLNEDKLGKAFCDRFELSCPELSTDLDNGRAYWRAKEFIKDEK